MIGSRSTVSVIGFRVLRELGIKVPLVITGDEDPGADDWRLSLAKAARDAGYRDNQTLLVCNNPHRPEILEKIRAASADIILSLQWRRILRPPLLQMAKNGTVNLHNAPLPLLRGCDPFSWAIHDGLEWMGVTLHQVIDEGIDSGPVLSQRLWEMNHATTAWQLYLDSLRESEKLMRDTLSGILSGQTLPRAQDQRYASYHPMGQFRFKDLGADWNLPAVTLSAALRSRIFPPFQLPFSSIKGKRFHILGCQTSGLKGRPGVVLSTNPLTIGTSRAGLEIISVRWNDQDLSGVEFAASAKINPGDIAGN